MRKDIKIGINTGDLVFEDTLQARLYPISVVTDGDVFLDLQITVPSIYDISKVWDEGIVFSLSYIPIYKPMRIRISRDYGEGTVQYLVNPTNNAVWFPVMCSLYGKNPTAICASQLMTVNPDFNFRIICDSEDGTAKLYSGVETDFIIEDSNKQNADLLLKCVPSNHYRYPTSGVGLVLYVNSNVKSTELSEVIQREFENDNVVVNNASFDSDTGELSLDLDTTNADANV